MEMKRTIYCGCEGIGEGTSNEREFQHIFDGLMGALWKTDSHIIHAHM
jgi:hypothetical protein